MSGEMSHQLQSPQNTQKPINAERKISHQTLHTACIMIYFHLNPALQIIAPFPLKQ